MRELQLPARAVYTGDDGGVVFCDGDAYKVNERALAAANFASTGRSDLSSWQTQHEALFALGLARKVTRDPRPFGSTPKPLEVATEGDVGARPRRVRQ